MAHHAGIAMTRLAAALLASLALALSLPAAAAAEAWRVGPAPSDHTDLKAATVVNDEGHTLYLWELVDENRSQIYCEMHLAEGMRFADAMPVYRIDDGKPVDTAAIRDAGEALDALWAHVGDTVAFWLLSPIPSRDGAEHDALAPWLNGREVEVSFRTADGVEKTTRFSLEGSAEAIRGATGGAQAGD